MLRRKDGTVMPVDGAGLLTDTHDLRMVAHDTLINFVRVLQMPMVSDIIVATSPLLMLSLVSMLPLIHPLVCEHHPADDQPSDIEKMVRDLLDGKKTVDHDLSDFSNYGELGE